MNAVMSVSHKRNYTRAEFQLVRAMMSEGRTDAEISAAIERGLKSTRRLMRRASANSGPRTVVQEEIEQRPAHAPPPTMTIDDVLRARKAIPFDDFVDWSRCPLAQRYGRKV